MKAVIDLGSNTFHLLIVEIENGVLNTVFRQRIFVRLLEGISENQIDKNAAERAKKAANILSEKLKEFKVDDYTVIATASLRDIKNGKQLKKDLEFIYNTNIQILTEEEEAMFIFKGVKPTINNLKDPYLIMDIGGGSIEFIGVSDSEPKFFQSYPIGLHKLSEMIAYTGVLSENDYAQLDSICQQYLGKFISKAKELGAHTLVGNAGSFEICNEIANSKSLNRHSNILDLSLLKNHFKNIRSMSESEIKDLEWVSENRSKMLPLAFGYIDIILNKFEITQLIYSPYSVKEGILLKI